MAASSAAQACSSSVSFGTMELAHFSSNLDCRAQWVRLCQASSRGAGVLQPRLSYLKGVAHDHNLLVWSVVPSAVGKYLPHIISKLLWRSILPPGQAHRRRCVGRYPALSRLAPLIMLPGLRSMARGVPVKLGLDGAKVHRACHNTQIVLEPLEVHWLVKGPSPLHSSAVCHDT